jgi:transaldolase
MKPIFQSHDLNDGLWLNNITRKLLDDGTLACYIAQDSWLHRAPVW